jgi:hypothetical protein
MTAGVGSLGRRSTRSTRPTAVGRLATKVSTGYEADAKAASFGAPFRPAAALQMSAATVGNGYVADARLTSTNVGIRLMSDMSDVGRPRATSAIAESGHRRLDYRVNRWFAPTCAPRGQGAVIRGGEERVGAGQAATGATDSVPNQTTDDFRDGAQESYLFIIEVSLVEILPNRDGRAHQQDGDAGPLARRYEAVPHDFVQHVR